MIHRAKNAIRGILPKNAFARGVSVLVGGTAGAQLITVLAAPLLTRLYGPEDFGLVAVYGSLLALIGVVSSLRYELAIPLPEDDVEAANVAVLSLLLVALTTVLSGVLVAQLATPITSALGVPVLAGYLWLLPVGVMLGGGYNVFNYWSVRTKRFSTIASTRIRQSLATLAIQLTAFKLGSLALLLAQVVGQSVGTSSLARPALAMLAFRQVSWGGVWQAAVRYRRFPIFSTWEGLFNVSSHQLGTIGIAIFFSVGSTGIYALAHRVLSLPMSLIGGAIGQVFFASAAKASRDGNLGFLFSELHAKLAHIGLPVALLLVFVGPELFGGIFGADWRQAGEFARYMAPWLYLQFISSPLSTVFCVREQQLQGMSWQVVLLGSRLLAILIGGFWLKDIEITIILFSAASAISYLILIFWIARLSNCSFLNIARSTFIAAAISLVCVMPLIISSSVFFTITHAWAYALGISLMLITFRYLILLRSAY
ncbi:MAG: lipopolysaccharide biosynthesis protein [Gammaproteobacteria bacterium]|nr:lipopolysaccharide biosynthesis protein [Gammaproteobacteria bacterium]